MNIKILIDPIYKDDRWENFKKNFLKRIIHLVLHEVDEKLLKINWEISLIFTNKEEVENLNKQYRKKDKDTNVLSFQYINWTKNLNNYEFLGDIVFSYDKILAESKNKNISFNNHFIHLFIHGLLHLLGYDHQTEHEASIMENLEISILKNLNINSPY